MEKKKSLKQKILYVICNYILNYLSVISFFVIFAYFPHHFPYKDEVILTAFGIMILTFILDNYYDNHY